MLDVGVYFRNPVVLMNADFYFGELYREFLEHSHCLIPVHRGKEHNQESVVNKDVRLKGRRMVKAP